CRSRPLGSRPTSRVYTHAQPAQRPRLLTGCADRVVRRGAASERQRVSHANGARRRSGARESVSGSPRGEAPRMIMKPGVWRHPELVFAAIMCTIVALSGPRLAQPLGYHRFADTRAFFGVPNALGVLSTAPFAIVGIASLFVVFRVHTFVNPVERWSYVVLFAGVTLTAFGSAYYHLAPDNDRLVWDRLPMAVGFMGLLAAIVAER